MANIRTLGQQRPPEQPDPPQNTDSFNALFQSTSPKAPQDETFLDMLRFNIFPQFRLLSFTFAMMLLFAAVFLAQGLSGGIVLEGALLQMDSSGLTAACVLSRARLVEQKQFHRLLLAALAHRNFGDLLGTAVSFLVWVSWVERIFGAARSALIFALGAATAFAFLVAVFRAEEELGPTVGNFALMGASIGFMLYHWQRLTALHLFCMLQVLLVLLPFAVAYALTGNVRNFAHALVGLCAGLLLGVGFSPDMGLANSLRRKLKCLAFALVALAFSAAILCAFFA